ncbi:MAG: hypothetical protein ACLUI3_07065 [Christensenellales bacterium]
MKDPQTFADDVAFMMFPVSQYNDKPFVIAGPGAGHLLFYQVSEICKDLFAELANNSYDLLADHANTIFTLSP